MSAVVGVDLSSRALDLVKLDESSNRAEWVRVELAGKDAWERTLAVRDALPPDDPAGIIYEGDFWGDVYLVAIEEPRGRGQLRTNAVLNRVVGAVAASLPARLRVPERCWVVRPDEYRTGLGLRHNTKPSTGDLVRITGHLYDLFAPLFPGMDDQNARDAYCLAMWARDKVAAAAGKTAA